MSTTRIRTYVTALAASILAFNAFASRPPVGDVIRFGNGTTSVDILGDGSAAHVVTGTRQNFNAHGYDAVSFYVEAATNSNGKAWNIIPVVDGTDEKLSLTVSGGADCLLHDLRLVRMPGERYARLVVADRELGESFADAAEVTFTFYDLMTNRDGEPGRPLYYFTKARVSKASRAYCDVGEALSKELGLGPRQ
jgi:hypothetical protein